MAPSDDNSVATNPPLVPVFPHSKSVPVLYFPRRFSQLLYMIAFINLLLTLLEYYF